MQTIAAPKPEQKCSPHTRRLSIKREALIDVYAIWHRDPQVLNLAHLAREIGDHTDVFHLTDLVNAAGCLGGSNAEYRV
ncbi:hypothetical protein NKI32_30955 [Mesorhizobium sp. M0761]|uniref:hypothetical protein n=1 Tax=Mesorhizobium sp. M0761 TaxID=2956994 RepID=UPI00333D7A4A